MSLSLTYKVLLKPEPEGGYTVNVPALPGCITYGETLEEAKVNAQEAIELYVESLMEHGEDIPTDIDVLEYNLQLSA
jgi:antitoxin HicB